jgi:hypothetical protein
VVGSEKTRAQWIPEIPGKTENPETVREWRRQNLKTWVVAKYLKS